MVETPYPLGRHKEHDEQSRGFAFTGPPVPTRHSIQHATAAPVLNQGSTNGCVGNAFAQLLGTQMFAPVLSALHHKSWLTETEALNIYHLATHADGLGADFYPPTDNGTSALGGAKALQQLGFIDHYCLVPTTRVLTESLEWVPVGSLSVGDRLIAFDEYAGRESRAGRRWRGATVTASSIIRVESFEVQTTEGSVTCSGAHRWLVRRPGAGFLSWNWVKTTDLRPSDEIKYMPTWEADDSFDAGYVAGIFDGEGSLCVKGISAQWLNFSQNPGPVLDEVVSILERHKFDLRQETNKPCTKVLVRGGLLEIMRFLGVFRPRRLSAKLVPNFYGRCIGGKPSPPPARVMGVIPVGIKDVVALGTSTRTLIAEGMFSHNSHTFTFNDFLAAIQLQPVTVGTDWTDPMFEPDRKGFVHPGPLNDSTISGGHEYLCRGVNFTSQTLTFRNSWGPVWGVGGEFYMSFKDFQALLKRDGDVVMPHGINLP